MIKGWENIPKIISDLCRVLQIDEATLAYSLGVSTDELGSWKEATGQLPSKFTNLVNLNDSLNYIHSEYADIQTHEYLGLLFGANVTFVDQQMRQGQVSLIKYVIHHRGPLKLLLDAIDNAIAGWQSSVLRGNEDEILKSIATMLSLIIKEWKMTPEELGGIIGMPEMELNSWLLTGSVNKAIVDDLAVVRFVEVYNALVSKEKSIDKQLIWLRAIHPQLKGKSPIAFMTLSPTNSGYVLELLQYSNI